MQSFQVDFQHFLRDVLPQHLIPIHLGEAKGPDQRSQQHHIHGAGIAGLFGQLRGPVGGGGGQVQADAHHQPLQPPALQVGADFGEDAAHLFALIIQVVDPLDAQFQPAQLLYRPAHRHGGPDGGRLGAGRRAGVRTPSLLTSTTTARFFCLFHNFLVILLVTF